MKKDHIPKPILEKVENELLAEERLLWVGLPNPFRAMGQTVQPDRRVGALVALMLGGLISGIVASGGTLDPMLMLTGLVLTFAAILSAVFTSRYLQARQMVYAITNRRAFSVNGARVQSYGAQQLQSIERRMNSDGSGDIIFEKAYVSRPVPVGAVMVRQNVEMAEGFFGIENPQAVEALILETFNPDINQKAKRLSDSAVDEDYYEEDSAETSSRQY